MKLRFDAILYSKLGNENLDSGHIKYSRGPQVPHPCSRVLRTPSWFNVLDYFKIRGISYNKKPIHSPSCCRSMMQTNCGLTDCTGNTAETCFSFWVFLESGVRYVSSISRFYFHYTAFLFKAAIEYSSKTWKNTASSTQTRGKSRTVLQRWKKSHFCDSASVSTPIPHFLRLRLRQFRKFQSSLRPDSGKS